MDVLQTLVESMPDRVAAVIAARGGPTRDSNAVTSTEQTLWTVERASKSLVPGDEFSMRNARCQRAILTREFLAGNNVKGGSSRLASHRLIQLSRLRNIQWRRRTFRVRRNGRTFCELQRHTPGKWRHLITTCRNTVSLSAPGSLLCQPIGNLFQYAEAYQRQGPFPQPREANRRLGKPIHPLCTFLFCDSSYILLRNYFSLRIFHNFFSKAVLQLRRERDGVVGRQLASHLGGPGSIPGGVAPRFSHLGIVLDDAAGRWGFSEISRLSRPFIPALLHTHVASPSASLKTSILTAAQISSLTPTMEAACAHKCMNSTLPSEQSAIFQVPRTPKTNQWLSLGVDVRQSVFLIHTQTRTLASHTGEPGSIPGRVTRFSQVGIVPDDAVDRRVLLGDLPFPSAPSFRRRCIFTSLTLIGSEDLDDKSHPNLFTHSQTHMPVATSMNPGRANGGRTLQALRGQRVIRDVSAGLQCEVITRLSSDQTRGTARPADGGEWVTHDMCSGGQTTTLKRTM
ncbi:hypothetical protein PR048_001460 [Dryococelus australis]|uniref:Uncharacterized protein n=1 Tax=Dryococelus australis TaxID=614101 RepID=A0ABQ9IHF0_9NEOP|nr:hypothetical protein PR048_001460 [Dryococelus australis]